MMRPYSLTCSSTNRQGARGGRLGGGWGGGAACRRGRAGQEEGLRAAQPLCEEEVNVSQELCGEVAPAGCLSAWSSGHFFSFRARPRCSS
eukprot:scaffold90100_cov64-Phaeocystis_antarctica.AAC.5